MYFHFTIFPLNSSIKVAYWDGAKMSTKHRLLVDEENYFVNDQKIVFQIQSNLISAPNWVHL